MATKIKLHNFLKLPNVSIQSFAKDIGNSSRSVYNWLNDQDAVYTVYYDARNNKIIKVERVSTKTVYRKSDEH